MFIVQACYYFGNFEIQVWQIPCICNVLQSTAAVFMQYVKTYFRTFQYNIFLHKYYCRLFVPNQRTQFYLKRLLTLTCQIIVQQILLFFGEKNTYTTLLGPTRLLISEKSATYTIKWSYTIIWQVRVLTSYLLQI